MFTDEGGYGIGGGGGWLDSLKQAVFGQQRTLPPRYDAIRARELAAEMDLNQQIAGDRNPSNPVVANQTDQWGQGGRPPLRSGGPPGGDEYRGVPQVQEDPLDRFERIARLMEFGETVGSAFDKPPSQIVSVGGGLGQPTLPRSGGYGLSGLR